MNLKAAITAGDDFAFGYEADAGLTPTPCVTPEFCREISRFAGSSGGLARDHLNGGN
jgi:hypothetical protein